MATIQYTRYSFNKPPDLTESDYKTLKELLNDNSKLNINPTSSFIQTFKVELIMLGIGIISGFIAFIDIAEWINWIFGIPAFIAGWGFIFSFLPSFLTYIDFVFDKSRYYSKLKRDIIKSKTYIDFNNIREKRRWN
jgi:cytochrome c biogenesis protein CcdA